MLLPITDIQRFCMHDGPGIRTTVFFKGCPLRCKWCHNPEMQNVKQEILFYEKKCISCGSCIEVCKQNAHIIIDNIHVFDHSRCNACGECIDVCIGALTPAKKTIKLEEIVSIIEKDRPFYKNHGGVTLSGGEPLMHPTEAFELLKECKSRGISTAIETCGYFASNILKDIIKYTDLFLWDIKDTDNFQHRLYTGKSNDLILDNLQMANKLGANIRLRCILVKDVNTFESHYKKIAEIALSLSKCQGVEFIPYHAYGGSKMLFMGQSDNGRQEWIPSKEIIEKACKYMEKYKITVLLSS